MHKIHKRSTLLPSDGSHTACPKCGHFMWLPALSRLNIRYNASALKHNEYKRYNCPIMLYITRKLCGYEINLTNLNADQGLLI